VNEILEKLSDPIVNKTGEEQQDEKETKEDMENEKNR